MKSEETRKYLVEVTAGLLREVYDLDEITIRKIADEAHAATGLVNYYFKSKNDLLYEAINLIIHEDARSAAGVLYDTSFAPGERLCGFLKRQSDIMFEYEKYTVMTIEHELLRKDFETAQFIVPVISDIKPDWSQERVKYAAFQIVSSLQVMFYKKQAFEDYLGCKPNYHHAIDMILNNLGLYTRDMKG